MPKRGQIVVGDDGDSSSEEEVVPVAERGARMKGRPCEVLAQRRVMAAQRLLKMRRARASLLDFIEMMMPDPAEPEDVERSRYEISPHHRLIAEALEKVERGQITRLVISLAPRHGKSELCTRMFPAWFLGKDPFRQCILAGASGEFAESEFGRKIKSIVTSPQYQQVFPLANLDKGSKAVGNLVFNEGGCIKSIGKGAQIVGRGADLLVIDDPIAGIEEAVSARERKKLWSWFVADAMSRLMPGGRVVIIHQRWHEDDLIGRLVDPKHPEHDKEMAAKWVHIKVPAIVKEPRMAAALGLTLKKQEDPEIVGQFGVEPMTALWPERFGLKFFAELHRQDSQSFHALFMGEPAPEDGDFFKKDWLKTYQPHQLPKNLRFYAASDHAVSTLQQRDATCMGCVGVDENDEIWVLPDLWWRREETDSVVDAMINLMREHRPLFWWAENGHISKSIGPFLRKRMREENVFVSIVEMTPARDKMTRARSIHGRMSMGMVHFPAFAPWWREARDELLKFPNAAHDDFVDFLAWIGIGLDLQTSATRRQAQDNIPKTGTWAWVKWAEKQRKDAGGNNSGGF